MKTKLRLKLPKGRGIIISTEMILLLTAVIMLAVVAFFGMSKMVLSQATSQKATLVVVRAEAWKISGGVAISLYLQNTGNQEIRITGYGIRFGLITSIYYCQVSKSVTLNPGEAKIVSIALGPNSGTGNGCNYLDFIDAGDSAYVYVTTSGGNEVGTAVVINNPS